MKHPKSAPAGYDVSMVIRMEWHRVHCDRRHFWGYPTYLIDAFGHWRG